MLAIAFRFPGGRYHATPWGRHVNEAAVAWPPEPWRIVRALIAVWHRKLDPARYPREHLAALLDKLASEPPAFHLPAAVHAHTRHYMPTRGNPSLVFDAFARVSAADSLTVVWSGVELDSNAEALLDALLASLGYLGRAESWVEACRVEVPAEPANCCPAGNEPDHDPVSGEILGERVRLLVARSSVDYAAFREHAIEDFGRSRKVADTLPADWLTAIGLDTSPLQKAGWNRPPAAFEVAYRRPIDALPARGPLPKRTPHEQVGITTARFALYGRPLPRIEDAVRVGEWLRAAVMSLARREFGADAIPPVISGHGLPEGNRHAHAFWLAEDSGSRGFIDHVIVHAADGLDVSLRRVLGRLAHVRGGDGEEWQAQLEWMGTAADEAAGWASKRLGSSVAWRSVTPYLHPWHAKRGFGAVEQLLRECRDRGLSEPVITTLAEVLAGATPRRPVHFHRFRRKRGLVQPDTHGTFFELRFPEPVAGTLALGFGCHFGLGAFERM